MCEKFTCERVGTDFCYANNGCILFNQDCKKCSKFTKKCSECLFYDYLTDFCILYERSVKDE